MVLISILLGYVFRNERNNLKLASSVQQQTPEKRNQNA